MGFNHPFGGAFLPSTCQELVLVPPPQVTVATARLAATAATARRAKKAKQKPQKPKPLKPQAKRGSALEKSTSNLWGSMGTFMSVDR